MDATGTLRLVFDADPWDSLISFAPGIPVMLGGTLELTFAPGVDVATQSGRTIDLFDWTGVTPTGEFTVSSPYAWNLSNLYTTGEVTLAAAPSLPGDFNLDGTVDAADYVVWRKGLGTTYAQDDYNVWQANFGATLGSGAALPATEPLSPAVPEPTSLALLLLASAALFVVRRTPFRPLCVGLSTARLPIYLSPPLPKGGQKTLLNLTGTYARLTLASVHSLFGNSINYASITRP